jgi:hypothetical protein
MEAVEILGEFRSGTDSDEPFLKRRMKSYALDWKAVPGRDVEVLG